MSIPVGIGAAALAVLLAATAQAQAFRAAGTVRDSAGAPIAGASVRSSGAGTETDSLGRFVLPLTRTDSTTVTVRRLGFHAVTFTMPTDSLALNDLDVVLEASARALPGMDVSARATRVPTIAK